MKIVEIPGGTVSLREAHEVRQRHRKRVVSAGVAAQGALDKIKGRTQSELERLDMASLGLTFEEMEAFQVLQKAVIVASVVAWTRAEPVPDWDTVEDLPPDVYKALETVTAPNVGPVLQGVDFSPPDPRSPEFDESPTRPSDGSDPVLRADQESESEEASSTDGPSINTVVPSPA